VKKTIRCRHCRRWVPANPRIKNQEYCNRKPCQQARKTEWHRNKMKTDPKYSEKQHDAKEKWRRSNRDYWKQYRSDNKSYRDRNKELQKKRDQKRRGQDAKMDASDPGQANMDASININHINSNSYNQPSSNLAKMDASDCINSIKPGTYRIEPKNMDLAKMDASITYYIIIPECYSDLAKMDSIDIDPGDGPQSASSLKTGGQL